MPVNIKIDRVSKVVFTSFTGETTESDVMAVVPKLLADPNFDPTFAHVIDFSGATAVKISTDFVRGFAHRTSIFSPKARQVIIAPQDHMFGMARMVQLLREQRLPNVEVVRSREEALLLLGTQPSEN